MSRYIPAQCSFLLRVFGIRCSPSSLLFGSFRSIASSLLPPSSQDFLISARTRFPYTIPPTAAQVYDVASPQVFPSVSTLVGKPESPIHRFFAPVSSRVRNTSRLLSCGIGGIRWVTYCLERSPPGALFCTIWQLSASCLLFYDPVIMWVPRLVVQSLTRMRF